MIFLLAVTSLSFGDELHLIAAEIMFRNIGDDITNIVKKALSMVGEDLNRPSHAAAWISYVERPPHNVNSFTHWRYIQQPLNSEGLNITTHNNDDNLEKVLEKLNVTLTAGPFIPDTWSFNFALKTFMGLLIDLFDPIHTSEYFSSAYPKGDDSGRNFIVLYKGQKTSLHDFWASGCGKYNYSYPLNENQWNDVDQKVTELMKLHTQGSFGGLKKPLSYQLEQSFNISYSKVYHGVSPNTELSENYIDTCIKIVEERTSNAGYLMGKILKGIPVPKQPQPRPEQPVKSTEAVAWLIFCLLLPAAVFSMYDFIKFRSSLNQPFI